MDIFVFWFTALVVLPLAFQALAAPPLLSRFGLRAAVPVAMAAWLTPLAVLYGVASAPEIMVWILPLNGEPAPPPLSALFCFALPVWAALFAVWWAASNKQGRFAQSLICAGVSVVMLSLVSPAAQLWVLQNLLQHS